MLLYAEDAAAGALLLRSARRWRRSEVDLIAVFSFFFFFIIDAYFIEKPSSARHTSPRLLSSTLRSERMWHDKHEL
jgi:hypothetical protein